MLPACGEPHGVGARQGQRSLRADTGVTPERPGVGPAHVPDEQIGPGLVGQARHGGRPLRPGLVLVGDGVGERRAHDAVQFRGIGDTGFTHAVGAETLHAVGARAVDRHERILLRREAADHPSGRIEHVERQVLILGLEPIGDHHARRRVLAHRVRRRAAAETTPLDAPGVARLEQERVARHGVGGELAQRRDVVENPERAPVCRCHQVAVLDGQIVDRHNRQVAAQPLPVGAVVEGHPHTALGAREQQALPHRIFAHHAHEFARRDAGDDLGPGLSEVGGLPDIGRQVLELVAVGGDVRRPHRVVRRLDDRDTREVAQLFRRDVAPGFAAVLAEVDQPVIRPGPQHARLQRRLGQREHGSVVLGRRLIERDRPARGTKRPGVVAREVGRDRGPRLALIRGLEDHVGASVQHARVMRRNQQRRGPLEAIASLGRRVPVGTVRPGAHHPERVRAAHVVGEVVGRGDMIELRRGEVLVGPGLAAVERHVGAAIVGFDQALRVVGRDPQVVIVAVRIGHVQERLAAVLGAKQAGVHGPDYVGILGIGENLVIVPRPLAQLVLVVDQRPRGARVIGAEHTAVARLDQRPHPRRLRARHGDADVAE